MGRVRRSGDGDVQVAPGDSELQVDAELDAVVPEPARPSAPIAASPRLPSGAATRAVAGRANLGLTLASPGAGGVGRPQSQGPTQGTPRAVTAGPTPGSPRPTASPVPGSPGVPRSGSATSTSSVTANQALDTAPLVALARGAQGHELIERLASAAPQGLVPLEAVLSQLNGDQLWSLWDSLSDEDKRRFTGMLVASDLSPETRARLVGGVVDDQFFTGGRGDLVDAMTTGLQPTEARRFLDQLKRDGNLDDFLEPGGFWSILLSILTLGLFGLFMSDNRRGRQNLELAGWPEDRIRDEFDEHRGFGWVATILRNSLFGLVRSFIPEEHRRWADVANTFLGDRSIEDLREAPGELRTLGVAIARGAGLGMIRLLQELNDPNISQDERTRRIREFLDGLSPEALAQQWQTGDMDGSLALLSKRVLAGVAQELVAEARDGRLTWLNLQTVHQILGDLSTNGDRPIVVAQGSHPLIASQDMDRLREHMAFFQRYTGIDGRHAQIYYGGMAELGGAGMITTLSTISINRERHPLNAQGRIPITNDFLRVIAFHEMAHVWQQARYGIDVNSFVDQGLSIAAGGSHESRSRAYDVTVEAFDAATSIDAFRDHWEQQAEIVEWTMQTLWDNRANPAGPEAYPGPGRGLPIGPNGTSIPITPERWQKLMGFLREMRGGAAPGAGPNTTGWINPPAADGRLPF